MREGERKGVEKRPLFNMFKIVAERRPGPITMGRIGAMCISGMCNKRKALSITERALADLIFLPDRSLFSSFASKCMLSWRNCSRSK